MGFDITFQDVVSQRGAYRATIPGLTVRLADGVECVTRDLSAGGVGLVPPEGVTLRDQQILTLDILVAGQLYIQGLEAEVVRHTSTGVACSFLRLSRVQETRLDKLVLETQKRLIARRKAEEAKREQENKSAEGETPASGVISLDLNGKGF